MPAMGRNRRFRLHRVTGFLDSLRKSRDTCCLVVVCRRQCPSTSDCAGAVSLPQV